MKGLILAGGKGTRLRPITFSMAKQLVPVANKPVLFYGLEALAEAGIREVGIIVGDTAKEIEQAVGDGARWGLEVTYIPQPEPLGLAHAVLTAEPYLGTTPFLMYLGDNLLTGGVKSLVEAFEARRPNALILLAEVPNPQEFGVAQLEGERVVRLIEKPKEPPSNLALVGVYLFDSHIFEAARAIKPSWRGELEITDAIQYLIDQGYTVEWQKITGWWKDTGNLESLLEANRLVLEELPPRLQGALEETEAFGRVSVGEGSVLRRCVVRGPAIIGANCLLEECYIGPFTAIGDGVRMRACEIEFSIVLEGSQIDSVEPRIEASLLGKNTLVRGGMRRPRTLRLMLGDSSSVEMP
ncbi:MAG: glucose-1-phosphate thymidylyltransferase [Fimbriimonadales bacterium]|jgi:glucose-1-phosphate thymidylyltransferase|nr:glucose-1-phosphate thymidylyltransferase [Fimbriimonadales bacterium]GBC89841.1 Glucose-1-phosphate thymidylyltransferase 2 [bacterium HR14]GIV12799.1 MAG: glucose-1-phosphate thymidylyltransferase [Fimbriimonadales bacterium]CUU07212.1 glucose-1-phosphate thymidylyltransferase [Armatimonadetes bacterium GBS]CUU37868.1 glucose-1-phosphate thymidylyltransferase [Armatimonadetes bacterium GXS]